MIVLLKILFMSTILTLSLVDLGNDTSFCANEPFLLDASIENAESYLWQDGSTDSTFLANFSGKYFVEVEVNGCKSNDTIVVTFNNPQVNIGRDTFLCDEYFSLKAPRYDDAEYSLARWLD